MARKTQDAAETPRKPRKRGGWPKGKARKLSTVTVVRRTISFGEADEANVATICERFDVADVGEAVRLALELVAASGAP